MSVVDVDAVELDAAAHAARELAQRSRPVAVGDLGALVEHLGDALSRRERASDPARELREVLEGAQRELQVGREDHEVARRERALDDAPSSDDEHDREGEPDDHVGSALEARGEAARGDALAERPLVAVLEGAAALLLEPVRLHDPDRAERLGRGVRDLALALAGAARHRDDLAAARPRHDRVGERGSEHDEREQRIHHHHHDRQDHEGDHVADERQAGRDGHLLQPPDVADEALHVVAVLRAGVVLLPERLQMREHARAQARRDAGSDERENDRRAVLRDGAHADEPEQQDPAGEEQGDARAGLSLRGALRRAEAHGDGVDHDLQRPRLRDAHHDLDQHHRDAAGHDPALAAQVRPRERKGAPHGVEAAARRLVGAHRNSPGRMRSRVRSQSCWLTARARPADPSRRARSRSSRSVVSAPRSASTLPAGTRIPVSS